MTKRSTTRYGWEPVVTQTGGSAPYLLFNYRFIAWSERERARSVTMRRRNTPDVAICWYNGGLEETEHVRAPICLRGITRARAIRGKVISRMKLLQMAMRHDSPMYGAWIRVALMYQSIAKNMTSTHVRQRRNSALHRCVRYFFFERLKFSCD